MASGAPAVDDPGLLKGGETQLHYGGTTIATSPSLEKLDTARETFLGLLQKLKKDRIVTKIDLFVKTPRQPGARWG